MTDIVFQSLAPQYGSPKPEPLICDLREFMLGFFCGPGRIQAHPVYIGYEGNAMVPDSGPGEGAMDGTPDVVKPYIKWISRRLLLRMGSETVQ